MGDDLFASNRPIAPAPSSERRGPAAVDFSPRADKEPVSPFRKLQFTFAPSPEREASRSNSNNPNEAPRSSNVSRDSAAIELVRLANDTIVQSGREITGLLRNRAVIATAGHHAAERNYVDNPGVDQQNVQRIVQLVQTSLGVPPTGNYDDLTAARVLQFQQAYNQTRGANTLLEDGKVGKQTLGAILEELGLKNHPQIVMANRTQIRVPEPPPETAAPVEQSGARVIAPQNGPHSQYAEKRLAMREDQYGILEAEMQKLDRHGRVGVGPGYISFSDANRAVNTLLNLARDDGHLDKNITLRASSYRGYDSDVQKAVSALNTAIGAEGGSFITQDTIKQLRKWDQGWRDAALKKDLEELVASNPQGNGKVS